MCVRQCFYLLATSKTVRSRNSVQFNNQCDSWCRQSKGFYMFSGWKEVFPLTHSSYGFLRRTKQRDLKDSQLKLFVKPWRSKSINYLSGYFQSSSLNMYKAVLKCCTISNLLYETNFPSRTRPDTLWTRDTFVSSRHRKENLVKEM